MFSGKEITIEALLASACLPFIFQAVTIDGEPYWDGGYTGNPAIYPLVREGTPTRSEEIIDRLSEIIFNASLMREGKLDPGKYKADIGVRATVDVEREFLRRSPRRKG